jgi:CHASE2 domain-containing sensor protein
VDLGLLEVFASRHLSPRLTAEDYLIDFASIGAIQPVETTDPVVLRDRSHRRSFNGKVVILGDTTRVLSPREMFGVPNRHEPYPGTYVHAAAAHTLIAAPLYAVTGFGRLAIDLFFCLVVAVPVGYARARSRGRASPERFQAIMMTAVILGAILLGALSVGATRVMWTDFILAFAVLVLHPSIERWLHGLWTRVTHATERMKPKKARRQRATRT